MFTLPDFTVFEEMGKKLTEHISHVEKSLSQIDSAIEQILADLDELKISQKITKHIIQDKLK